MSRVCLLSHRPCCRFANLLFLTYLLCLSLSISVYLSIHQSFLRRLYNITTYYMHICRQTDRQRILAKYTLQEFLAWIQLLLQLKTHYLCQYNICTARIPCIDPASISVNEALFSTIQLILRKNSLHKLIELLVRGDSMHSLKLLFKRALISSKQLLHCIYCFYLCM